MSKLLTLVVENTSDKPRSRGGHDFAPLQRRKIKVTHDRFREVQACRSLRIVEGDPTYEDPALADQAAVRKALFDKHRKANKPRADELLREADQIESEAKAALDSAQAEYDRLYADPDAAKQRPAGYLEPLGRIKVDKSPLQAAQQAVADATHANRAARKRARWLRQEARSLGNRAANAEIREASKLARTVATAYVGALASRVEMATTGIVDVDPAWLLPAGTEVKIFNDREPLVPLRTVYGKLAAAVRAGEPIDRFHGLGANALKPALRELLASGAHNEPRLESLRDKLTELQIW